MCGIAGIAGVENHLALQAMVKAMYHRGPDDNGTWDGGNVHLGMARLSILDLSAAGHQPMFSPDGRYVLVYNGETYSFVEERRKLEAEGVNFISRSDTEVILHLYIKYKEQCVKYLRGMFAFAVWDTQEQQLFIARDHLGIKPLLFSYNNGVLVFCSEMKGMLASGFIPRKLSKQGLSLYLQKGYIAPPYTAVENVQMLKPGHCLTWKAGNAPQISPYWDIEKKPVAANTYNDAVNTVRKMVLDAVDEELVSDVPLGVFLSGGLDSSVVVSAMKALGTPKIDTFSVGFESDDLDETTDAEASAKYFDTNHHKVIVGDKEVADVFDHFIFGIDQPSIDGLNSYLVSKATKKNVTVALSGLGGDELFIGYSWQHKFHKSPQSANIIGGLLSPFGGAVAAMGSFGKKVKGRFINYSSAPQYYKNIHRLYSEEFLQGSLQASLGDISHDGLVEETIAQYPLQNGYTRLQQVAKQDLRYFMGARLLRDSDAVAMAHSLEVRFPLIDYRLVEYVWNLPDAYKIHHKLGMKELNKGFEQTLSYREGGVKKLLFDAFENELPANFDKRSKRGFKMPFEKWMRGLLADRVNEGISKLSGTIFTPQATQTLLNNWQSGKMPWNKVWALVVLQAWMEQNKIEV
ncbi:MAG: asparagine synthase (glutamine-hydrolyzing) [Bacteroidota bacterium]